MKTKLTTPITDRLSSITQKAITRWTAKSPRTYRILTDVSLGIGIAATALPMLPLTLPVWIVPAGAFMLALSAKLTINTPSQSDKTQNPPSPKN